MIGVCYNSLGLGRSGTVGRVATHGVRIAVKVRGKMPIELAAGRQISVTNQHHPSTVATLPSTKSWDAVISGLGPNGRCKWHLLHRPGYTVFPGYNSWATFSTVRRGIRYITLRFIIRVNDKPTIMERTVETRTSH